MEIKSSKPSTIAEAKTILSERKEDGELGYEQTQALEHCEKCAKQDEKASRSFADKLVKQGKIGEELAIKIADIRPTNPATVKAILAKDKVELSEDEINELIKELS